MKIFKKTNVWDESLARIRMLFDEFPNVIVGFSGGKDSTIVFNLALIVAKEKNRLPLQVLFLDQEAEWQATINMVKKVMYMPEVKPIWLQIPFRLQNATSHDELWLECWNPRDEENWIRPKEPIAIKENIYGTNRFKEMFSAYLKTTKKGKKSCYLAGVRAEESPTRTMGLTEKCAYKDITWAKTLSKEDQHFTFYPIYDWSFTDVWKAIYDNDWEYCKIYDYMFNYGVVVKNMRVSNVHHETAVSSLFYLQEIEPETYNKITARLSGVDTAGKLNKDDYFIKDLPFMFSDWREYREHLWDNLITDQMVKDKFRKKFDQMDKAYEEMANPQKMHQIQINSILTNDFEFTKIGNWEHSPEVGSWRKFIQKGVIHPKLKNNPYLKKYNG
jgi:predicted phosphoadenosine phosphosulfate sulfurtransferase